jgi:glycosyl transferase family 87
MGRLTLTAIFAVSVIYAGLVAIFSTDSVHRLWGAMAACGYVLALVVGAAWRKPLGTDLALALSFAGGLVVPLAWMAAHAIEQPEVAVVIRSGTSLLHHGTPYASAAVLANTHDPNAYNPYLPAMALFGLPSAIFGSGALTDPRIWFGVVFLVVFWFALLRGGARDPVRWTLLMAGSPVIALELAIGGTDVPMVAFLCLGFAYLWQPRPVLAGLALGIGSAMKDTAWPAVVVALALLAVKYGKRPAGMFTLAVLAVVAVCVGPFAVHPRSLVENTILFPLGLASVTSEAVSPLPGHLIAQTGHLGHTIVVAALVAVGLAVAVSLVFRPPRTVPRAVLLLAAAMTIMFVLAPSTRFGYFIYPATLAVWLLATVAGRSGRGKCFTPDPGEPPANGRTRWRTSFASRPAA